MVVSEITRQELCRTWSNQKLTQNAIDEPEERVAIIQKLTAV